MSNTSVAKVNTFKMSSSSGFIFIEINDVFFFKFKPNVQYLTMFLENIILNTDNWNYPTGVVEIYLETDKITLTTATLKYIFENNKVVRDEVKRFLEENEPLHNV